MTAFATTDAPVPLRPAATIVIVRDTPQGLQFLMLRRRARRSDPWSDSWVFPGGGVDADDAEVAPFAAGLDAATADARLEVDGGGLAYWIAAVRECFEEAGLLLARAGAGQRLLGGADEARLAVWRTRLNAGETSLRTLCEAEGLRLALDRVAYLSHWRTPVGLPKRFDTRFFVAEAPPGQEPLHDDAETTEFAWLHPADALARRKELRLALPTVKNIEAIAAYADTAALLAGVRALPRIPCIQPWVGDGSGGRRPVAPWEPAHAELARIDPRGTGAGSYEIRPGVAVRLSPRVLRVSADNGSVMTGPGTNCYLVGGGPRNEWAAIDPGPADERHVEAILAAAPGPIRWILATHTHHDHSPACALLAARTGAPVHGRIADHPEWQDAGFAPQVRLAGGEKLALDGATLRVLHTPGHASNHLCYLLEEEKTLFTGDHLMQLSTVVINPPDGDMAAYLDALRALLRLDLDWLAPGHGFLMAEPRRVIEGVIAHRLKREAKLVTALEALGGGDEDQLLARVYDDVPERLHPMARRSLRAHLAKLGAEGRAAERGGRWSPITA